MARKKAATKKSSPEAPAGQPAKEKVARKKAASKKSVRYTAEEKAEIVGFVQEHDKARGRGGQSAASKKFGVSALTISNWLKAAGKPKEKSAAKTVAKNRTAPENKKPAATGGKLGVLKSMAEIQEKVEQLRAEFEELKGLL